MQTNITINREDKTNTVVVLWFFSTIEDKFFKVFQATKILDGGGENEREIIFLLRRQQQYI